jgi:hypothetical protein
LKNISNIIVIDEQVSGTVERFHELKEKAAELPEIHDLLLNLISTGFRSRTLQVLQLLYVYYYYLMIIIILRFVLSLKRLLLLL